MNKTLIILLFLVLNSCKTTQKGFFYSSSEAVNIELKTVEEKYVFVSNEPKNLIYFKPNLGIKMQEFSIKNREILPSKKISKRYRERYTQQIQKQYRQKNLTTLKPNLIKSVSIKKKINRILSGLYVSLALVLLSIAAMVFLGNSGTFTIIFGLATLVLAFFFGMQSISIIKKGKTKVS